jgi:hypothetical protein
MGHFDTSTSDWLLVSDKCIGHLDTFGLVASHWVATPSRQITLHTRADIDHDYE